MHIWRCFEQTAISIDLLQDFPGQQRLFLANIAEIPMVYIVILNWNNARDTIACMQSLEGLAGLPFKIVICDNASTDLSFDAIKAWGKTSNLPTICGSIWDGGQLMPEHGVFFLQTGGNLGFAGGNNAGIKLALAQPNMEYVWLLNNDTEVVENSLSELVKIYETSPDIGICGSKLIYFHDRSRVQALGATYNKWLATSKHYLANSDPNSPCNDLEIAKNIDYVVGASMLTSRRFLERVGLMNESFFLYYEEIDWAMRAKKAGFRLAIASASHVFHKEGGTINSGSTTRSATSEYYYLKNRLLVTKIHFPICLLTVWLGGWAILIRRIILGDRKRIRIAFRVLFGMRC